MPTRKKAKGKMKYFKLCPLLALIADIKDLRTNVRFRG